MQAAIGSFFWEYPTPIQSYRRWVFCVFNTGTLYIECNGCFIPTTNKHHNHVFFFHRTTNDRLFGLMNMFISCVSTKTPPPFSICYQTVDISMKKCFRWTDTGSFRFFYCFHRWPYLPFTMFKRMDRKQTRPKRSSKLSHVPCWNHPRGM